MQDRNRHRLTAVLGALVLGCAFHNVHAATAVPALIEAEDFDEGGQGVAYHDNVAGNAGNQYRTEDDVDIIVSRDEGGGYDVNNFETGEWLNYTIDVAEAGNYTIGLRISTVFRDSAYRIDVDHQDVSGTVTVPRTGGWSRYAWLEPTSLYLGAGRHVITVAAEREYFNFNSLRVEAGPRPTAYGGTAAAVPGVFAAEDFDVGGEGVAYHDNVPGNAGGQYRPDEDVDIVPGADPEGGSFTVNNFETGEWLNYTIDVAEDNDYDVALRVASTFSDSAFRLRIDGKESDAAVLVSDTGGWTSYKWITAPSIPLTSGTHLLTIVSERQYFDLNKVEIAATQDDTPQAEPYSGQPAALPGTMQAEDFDLGGEGLGYHDNIAGNSGGYYRVDEDVDIVPAPDDAGNFDVKNFETGEWLQYTVDVEADSNYAVQLRVSSAFTDSAFRVEVDGVNVTGTVQVPDTGGWSAYQWIGVPSVQLAAGGHVVRVIAEQQYFNLDAVRVLDANSTPPPEGSAQLLFGSGFEGQTALLPPVNCWATGCWQEIVGLDTVTSFSWPSTLWDGDSRFLMLTDPAPITALTVGNYMYNRIESTGGHDGNQSQVLYQEISRNHNGTEPMGTSPTQNELEFQPKYDVEKLYVSFWIKLQPDLVEKMNNLPAGPGISGGGTWRAFFAMKTGSQQPWGDPASDGDYRIEAYVMTYGGGQPYWQINGDNTAGGGAPLTNPFSITNREVPVPVDKWFKFEIFWHRSDAADGRVWMAVDGQVIADRYGPNVGAWNMPVNRIMSPLLYSGGRMPIYQSIDDIEIWDGFPPHGNNPPYAAH